MDVQLPDGTKVAGVPDNMSRDEFVQKAKANGMQIPNEWLGQPAPSTTGAPPPAGMPAAVTDPNAHTYRVGGQDIPVQQPTPGPDTEVANVLRSGAGALVGAARGLPQAAATLTDPVSLAKGGAAIQRFMTMGVPAEPTPEWMTHAQGLSHAITNSTQGYTDYVQGIKDRVEAGLTPSFKAAAQKSIADGVKDPEWYLNGVAQVAAYAIPSIGPVAASSRLSYASKLLDLAGEDMQMSNKLALAEQAAHKTGQMVGAVANSAMFGGQTGQDVRDALEKLDDSTLMNYPEYREARQHGKSEVEAREMFIGNRANQATIVAGISADLPAAALNRFVAHAAVGHALANTTAGAALKGSIEGGVAGAVGMTGMTAAEKSQEAIDPDFIKAARDSKDEGLTGALLGAITGGMAAGGAHGRVSTTDAERLLRSQAADKSAADVRQAMQDKAAQEAAEEAKKHVVSEAAGGAARVQAKVERVTAEQADETHQTLQRARQDFIAAHQRVQTLEAHAADPSIPVSYNDLESARSARSNAYNEFHEAAEAAGILTTRSQAGKVQDNGRTETEGSDGDRQRRTGAETDSVRGPDQRGASGQLARAEPAEREGRGSGLSREVSAPSGDAERLKPLTPEEAPTPESEKVPEKLPLAKLDELGGPLTETEPRRGDTSGTPTEFEKTDQSKITKLESEKGVSDKQYAANYADIPASDRTLTDEQRKVESKMKTIVADVPAAEKAYAALPGSQGGRVINTDVARELSPEYNTDNKSRSLHANSVQEPASWLADKLFFRRMAVEPTGDKSVLFTAGGSDAGKSASLRSEDAKSADTVYDGNMNNLPKTRRRIRAALESGRNVKIQFTYRDPIDAFKNGVLPRAMKFGRTVPVEAHADTHNGSFKAVMALAKQYANDERVQIGVTDVSGGVHTLQDVAKKRYDVTPKQLRDIAVEEFKNGRITETVLRGTGGESAVRLARSGKDNGRLPGEPVGAGDQKPDTAGEAGRGSQGDSAGKEGDRGEPRQEEDRLGKDVPGTLQVGPLQDAPETVMVDGKEQKIEPSKPIRDLAERYTKAAGIDYQPPTDYKRVNPERARAIAKAYDEMKHDPTDPKVKASYDALIKETLAQWRAIKETGLKVEFIKPGENPYPNPRGAIADIRDNNHLWVYPTEQGFGAGADTSGHPLLAKTGEVIDGKERTANDIFRLVHDYFGHAKEANGFRADGEENAWRQHAAMYSEAALGAMTSETRGQNSWVNYGPHGDANRTANQDKTVYADQKAGLLPEKFWHDTDDQAYKVGNLRFRHFTDLSDERVTLDPEHYGKGLRGEEAKRIAAGAPKVISAYGLSGHVEPEFRGKNEYAIEVHPKDMYDLSADPAEIIEAATDKNGYDHTKAEKLIKQMGYKGYHLPEGLGNFKGQARFFEKMAATRVRTQRERVNQWGGKPDEIPLAGKSDQEVIANGGIADDVAKQITDHIKQNLGFPVTFVAHPRDVPEIDRWAAENLPITGIFTDDVNGGSVHLIQGNIGSFEHGVTAAYHEVVGHYGTRAILGGKGSEHYNLVMDQIANSFPGLTKQMAKRNGIQLQHADSGIRDIRRRSAAEEVVAYAAENRAQSGKGASVFKRVVAMIRDFLRSKGLLRSMTENDIASLIDRSAAFVRRGGAERLRVRDELSHEITGMPREYAFQNGTKEQAEPEQQYAVDKESQARVETRKILGSVSKYLSEAEQTKLSRASAQKLVDVFKGLPEAKEFAAAALAGNAKRGWYKESSEAIANVFGPDGPRFAALLSALSPQVSVEMNLHNALHTFINWDKAGRPTERNAIVKIMGASVLGDKGEKSVMNAWIPNSVRALTHPEPEKLTLSGPKVNSFMRNLQGHVHEVTLDAWMANFANLDQTLFKGGLKANGLDPGKSPGYLGYSARVRQAADVVSKLTGEKWTPAEIQETIWSWAKTAYETANSYGELGSVPELVRNKELTDDLIKATPDFKTLFHSKGYEDILRNAGYGDRVDELRAASETAGKVTPSEALAAAQEGLTRHLNRAAERLEGLRQDVNQSRVDTRRANQVDKRQMPMFQVSKPDSPEMAAFLAKINPKQRDERGLKERIADIAHGIQQGVFNEFHGIERAYKEGGGKGPNIGFMKAELTRNAGQLLASTIKDGVPIWNNGEVALDTKGGGFQDILAPLGNRVQDWYHARVARRALRLIGEGREHNFTPEEVAAGNRLWTQNPEFEKAFQARARFAARILDFAQEAGVINGQTRPTWENADHIPFYRLAGDTMDLTGGIGAGRSIGRVKDQIKRLKGGAAPIGDPMTNEIQNWGSLLKASLHNAAISRVVTDMKGMQTKDGRPMIEAGRAPTDITMSKEAFKQRLLDTDIDPASLDQATLDHLYRQQHGVPEDPHTIWHMVNGQKVYWKVNDDQLFQSLVNLNGSGESEFLKFWSKWVGSPGRLLRKTIVNSPVFAAKIAVRHTQYLWVLGRYGSKNIGPEFKPLVDSIAGFYSILSNSEEAKQMKAAGGLFSDAQAYGEPRNAAARLKLRLATKSVPGTVLSSVGAIADFYHRFLNAAEGMNRIAIANSAAKAGASRTEQVYAARKVLDYTQKGNHWLTKMFITSIPFTTGHLAGLDALKKQAVNNPAGFLLRGSMLAAAAVAYAALNHKNPEYQALTDDQKTSYFHFFNVFKDGDHWQVPKSFEDGDIFVTIPEALTDMALSNENDRVRSAVNLMAHATAKAFEYDYLPTEIRPIVDLATNKQNYNGAPVLTQRDLEVQPKAQDAPYVSPTIRAFSQAMPDAAPDWLQSPKQLQFLASGYLGTIGQYVTAMADVITRKALDEGAPAGQSGIAGVPSVNQIYRTGPATRTKYTDSMYTVAKQIAEDYATMNSKLKGGDPKGAVAFERAHADELKVKGIYEAALKQASEVRKYQMLVQQDKSMTSQEKQKRIETSQKTLDAIAERVYHFRPGGPLSAVAPKLIGATTPQKINELQSAGLPATASLVRDLAA